MTPRRLLMAAASAVLVFGACTSVAPSNSPSASAPAPRTSPEASLEPGSTAESTSGALNATPPAAIASPGTAEIAWDYGPGTFDFPAPAAGLSDLESYKSTVVIAFAGTEAGQPSEWSNTYEMISLAGGADRQLTLETTGAAAEGGAEPTYRAELNGVAYERAADAACTTAAVQQDDSLALRWEPAGFLTGVTAAAEAGVEDVNGVSAAHYSFDERAFGSLPAADSAGDVWVAADGGFVVRYLLTTTGAAEYFGEGTEGTLSVDYQLTDINAAPAIELPDDCSAGVVDVPLLPDAADVVRAPELVSYATASTTANVIAFYQEQLPGLGWAQTGEPTLEEPEAFANFTRDGEQLSVLIAPVDAGSRVRLILAAVVPPE